MKRILMIAASLKVGGAEKVARDIGLYGDPEYYQPHYVVFHPDEGEYEAQIRAHGGMVFHMENPAANYPAFYRELCKLMKQYRYHAVHAHTMFNCGWVMLAAKRMGIPVRVAHAHSALDNGKRILKQIYEAGMRFLILRYATHLVACGEKAGIRLFGEKAYRKRGQLILNGVDAQAFRFQQERREQIRQQLGWQDSYLIGHVGHLCSVKNQSFLLELMPLLLEKKPQTKLLLLGEGPDRAMLEEKIQKLQLGDRVYMPGNVTNVADYLSAMDVFVFPSLFEGLPLSVLEVQANGLPCVISTGVPRDVYATDLLQPLALDREKACWVSHILASQRKTPEAYARKIQEMGFDISGAMEKIYRIYGE